MKVVKRVFVNLRDIVSYFKKRIGNNHRNIMSGSYELVGFKQKKETLTIFLNRRVKTIKYIRVNNLRTSFNLHLLRKEAQVIEGDTNSISFNFDGENVQEEHSIIFFIEDKYIELVRQPEEWLIKNYSFEYPGGRTILGRRSLKVGKGKVKNTFIPLKLIGMPDLIKFKPIQISNFNEINLASGLLATLYSKPIPQGYTAQSYSEFLNRPFEEKIKLLQNGDFTVMCSGFRDLFAHASFGVPNLKIRLVDCLNYAPQYTDLITYGHALVEIWIKSLSKWALFDPWNGITVMKNDKPINSQEIKALDSFEGVKIIPIIDEIPRRYTDGTGRVIFYKFSPSNIKLQKFYKSLEKLEHHPGYADYFHNINIYNVVVKQR